MESMSEEVKLQIFDLLGSIEATLERMERDLEELLQMPPLDVHVNVN